jgi:hypothetical protein
LIAYVGGGLSANLPKMQADTAGQWRYPTDDGDVRVESNLMIRRVQIEGLVWDRRVGIRL